MSVAAEDVRNYASMQEMIQNAKNMRSTLIICIRI